MERYIDLEELIKRIRDNVLSDDNATPYEMDLVEWCKDECIRQGYAMPTADVAPKSEVAEELINMALSKIQIMISAVKAQEENGIITEFNGGAKTALEIVFKDLAELKKKYTEEKK